MKTEQSIADEWLASRRIIADFLREMRPDLSQGQLDHNAAAIIARLASNQPPILMSFVDLTEESA